jgi:ADP-glucose pyrophosphorylase
VLTRNEERPPARFGERSRETNSLVAGGAAVDGTVMNSVVFAGAWIEEGATVEDAVVFHDGWIGKGARVARAILDKDVIVGENARVGDPAPAEDADSLAVLGKEAVVLAGETIPPGTMVPVGGGRGRACRPPRPPSRRAGSGRDERRRALRVLVGGRPRLAALFAFGETGEACGPFGGKYRIIDFTLSNCVNSGIFDVGVLTQYKPGSLRDHIGSGRPWDLDRNRGGITILQPFQGSEENDWYRGTPTPCTRT